MRFRNRHAQIDDEILGGQRIDLIFELLEPLDKFVAILAPDAGALVREVRSDIAVCEDGVAGSKFRFNLGFCFVAIACIEQSGEVSVHAFERAEIAIQKARDELAEESVIARETDLSKGDIA